jgi:hypothetical protein
LVIYPKNLFQLAAKLALISAICYGDFTEVTPNYVYMALNKINNFFWEDSEKINAY